MRVVGAIGAVLYWVAVLFIVGGFIALVVYGLGEIIDFAYRETRWRIWRELGASHSSEYPYMRTVLLMVGGFIYLSFLDTIVVKWKARGGE